MKQERLHELLIPRLAQLLLQRVGVPIHVVPLAAVMLVGVEHVAADLALVWLSRVVFLPPSNRSISFASWAMRKDGVRAEIRVAERGQRDMDGQFPADCSL